MTKLCIASLLHVGPMRRLRAPVRPSGGRFNRKGFEALYLSQTVATAVGEYRQYERLLAPGTLVTFLVSKLTVVDFSLGYR